MQIVIEITDRMYEDIKQDRVPIDIGRFIRNGTPLPTVTPKQQTCEDCISRQAAIDCLNADFTIDGKENMETVVDYINGAFKKIKALPSVTPQPKVGKWIRIDKDKLKCSECEVIHYIAQYPQSANINYCPNCGTKMEVEEC